MIDSHLRHPDSIGRGDAVDFILALFRHMGGRDYLGESVSQGEHGLQSALGAAQTGAPPTLVVAALLHDIGHYLHGFEEACAERGIDSSHERVGADFLARFFPPAITEPVRLHVAAKRYLCARQSGYAARLTPASQHSLRLQGGPMSAAECADFAADPHGHAAITLRQLDDGAKVKRRVTPDIESYRDLMTEYLR